MSVNLRLVKVWCIWQLPYLFFSVLCVRIDLTRLELFSMYRCAESSCWKQGIPLKIQPLICCWRETARIKTKTPLSRSPFNENFYLFMFHVINMFSKSAKKTTTTTIAESRHIKNHQIQNFLSFPFQNSPNNQKKNNHLPSFSP